MQATRTPAMDFRAVLGAIVVSISFFVAGAAGMSAVQVAYMCEHVDGYNPAGTTRDEKYPPGTWAGICMKSESDGMAAYGVFLVGGLAGMAVAVAAAARSG